MTDRINLIKNSSFRSGTAGWVRISNAFIETVAGGVIGGSSLAVYKSDEANSGVRTAEPIELPIEGYYAASAYVRVPVTVPATEAASLSITITWLDSSGLVISENTTPTVTIQPNGLWVRLSGIFFAPHNAVRAYFTVSQILPGSTDEIFHVDAVLFEQSDFVGGYLDNFTPGQESTYVNTGLTPLPTQTFGGLDLKADVIINDLVLNTIDEDGVVWVCTDIDGWWGHSEPDIPDITRGTEDGSYNVSGRYQARVITLKGTFLPRDPSQLGKARDKLIAATNLAREGGWLRTNEQPTRAAFVRLSGRPNISTVNARGRTDFSIGLRAADPVRYEWNDSNVDGMTVVTLTGNTAQDGYGLATYDSGQYGETGEAGGNIANVVNKGTAPVTALFEMDGPLGAGSTVTNAATGEVITLTSKLRSNTPVGRVISAELFNEVATLITSEKHDLAEGDTFTVFGVGDPFDSTSDPYVVLSVTDIAPYTVTFRMPGYDNVNPTTVNGAVALAERDTLLIDTYEKSVTFNGTTLAARGHIDTLVDWIKLAPGSNTIVFHDEPEKIRINRKAFAGGTVTLTSKNAHYLNVGTLVRVALAEDQELKRKAISGGKAILTTKVKHGFSVGDTIDVHSTEKTNVVRKRISGGVATLTTDIQGDFAPKDEINVDLPLGGKVIVKEIVNGVITLTMSQTHGFSEGDQVTVEMSGGQPVIAKALSSNVATLTTAAPHNFSLNDAITVDLPTTATVTNKARSGNSVVITTNGNHGFSTGDRVQVNFPSLVTPNGTRSYDGQGTYLITLTTSAPHNFIVGDSITVDIKVPVTATVTNKSYTTTTSTITTSAAHNFAVGEIINVSIGDAAFNGDQAITAVTATTITWADSHSSSLASTTATGTVTNKTIRDGYNGTQVIQSATANTLSYYYYGGKADSSSTYFGASPTITNTTNTAMNGSYLITSNGSNSFSYTVGG